MGWCGCDECLLGRTRALRTGCFAGKMSATNSAWRSDGGPRGRQSSLGHIGTASIWGH